MAIFVYVTESCKKDAKTHSLEDELDRFRDRVERTQSISHFDPFPAPYLVKKKFGSRQGRLIAERHSVGEHAVVVLLAVLIRGKRAYITEFARRPAEYGDRHWLGLTTEESLMNYVQERTKVNPPPEKPDLSSGESTQLYEFFAHHSDPHEEDMVYETPRWIERVGESTIGNQLTLVCRTLLDSLECDDGLNRVSIFGKDGWSVFFFRRNQCLLLLTIATEPGESVERGYADQMAQKLYGQEEEAVLKASRRAYPAILLADDDLWIRLEKEKVANMALSPEESVVLERARHSDQQFPLFINGRAGSGKSTILQYLYADILFYQLTVGKELLADPPIYLTASGDLLDRAREFVTDLLRSEARFVQQNDSFSQLKSSDLFDSAFSEFKKHLLSLLPQGEISRFSSGRYIDYAEFQRRWHQHFARDRHALRDYGPDISWHVIRSYIKGMSSDGFLEPEDYEHLPSGQKSVTGRAFLDVYRKVWEAWYSGLTGSTGEDWDDQDLARFVLEEEFASPKHSAVFCDEAQDFTRIELELLLRLNLYSDRKIEPHDISRIPFAFAGDPFQTLNPTGFRWESIKASFVEKFIRELDPGERSGRTDLNYCELNYNYRSTQQIVWMCNLIQLFRAALFRLPDLRPQTPWTDTSTASPVIWYQHCDPKFWEKFEEELRYVLIVPCAEGEETDYVRNDPVLNARIKIAEDVPQNVLSAVRAKGCEYPDVVVYGFGEASEKSLLDLVADSEKKTSVSKDESLPLQYFINRLYVAASRAKRQLIIVDTEAGFEKLWRFATDRSAIDELLSKVKNGHAWKDHVQGIRMGQADDLNRDEKYDPIEKARLFEQEGKARRDSFYFRQAAMAYRAAKLARDAKRCEACAFETDGRWLQAGELFFQIEMVSPEGVTCLWKAAHPGWKRLCELVSDYPTLLRELEFDWAKALTDGVDQSECISLLQGLKVRLENDKHFREQCIMSGAWTKAVDELVWAVADMRAEMESGIDLQILNALRPVVEFGVQVSLRLQGHIAFSEKRYPDAIRIWEANGDTKERFFFAAKVFVEPYPANLQWLEKLGRLDEILRKYEENRHTRLDGNDADLVRRLLLNHGRYHDAIDSAWHSQDWSGLAKVTVHAFQHNSKQQTLIAARAAVYLMAQAGQWNKVLSLVDPHGFRAPSEWNDSNMRKWLVEKQTTFAPALVRAFARSELLPMADTSNQKRVSDFLRAYLRVRGGTWRGSVSELEAGAAFERAGRFVDTLAFYDALLREDISRELQTKIAHRWFKNKYRQQNYEREQSHSNKLKLIENDINKMRRKFRQPAGELPNYPMLSQISQLSDLLEKKLSPEISRPERESHRLGSLSIVVSRKLGRVNIEDTHTMEQGWIKITERTCGGTEDFEQIDHLKWGSKTLGLTVLFDEHERRAVLRLAGYDKELKVAMPTS